MKKSTIIVIVLIIAAFGLTLMSGCQSSAPQGPSFETSDIALNYQGQVVRGGSDASVLISALGDGYEYSEAISCNYAQNGVDGADGMDKFFDYPGVSVTTCPMQPGMDNIRSIEVSEGDQFKTTKGIGIGSSRADIEAAYGKASAEDSGMLFYYSNPNDPASAQLYFILENDVVSVFGIA